MALKLVKLTKEYQRQLTEMVDEWAAFNKEHPEANTSPWAIFKGDYKNDFDNYLSYMYDDETKLAKGYVPDVTLFLYDDERDIFIGAANIRKYLNERLLNGGGHIGDGIRPTERGKGYGTLLVKLALEECKKLGINRVLMCCNKFNEGSRKTIIKNGGVLENEVPVDDSITQRYWINL